MRASRAASPALCAVVLVAACAGQRDHFYSLSIMPQSVRPPATGYATHVILEVAIPDTVDRRQMVIDEAGDRMLVLEHERWATPLSDLVTQTLARDLEQRRADVLVANRGFDQAAVKPVHIQVDVVRLSASRGGGATLEAHWRIVDPAAQSDLIGGETFTAPIAGGMEDGDYAPLARAISACLASLAERLAQLLPAG